jgi:hypothetical protein
MLAVGVDPGKDTGLCIYNLLTKQIQLQTVNTYGLICYLQQNAQNIQILVIENSSKQSFVWNKQNKTSNALSRHARNIGSVDGRSNVILETCEALNIDYKCLSPMQKGKKWSHKEFTTYVQYTTQTNQHERDAAKLLFMLQIMS